MPAPSGRTTGRAFSLIIAVDVAVMILAPWLIHPAASALGVTAVVLLFSAVCEAALVIAHRRAQPRGHRR